MFEFCHTDSWIMLLEIINTCKFLLKTITLYYMYLLLENVNEVYRWKTSGEMSEQIYQKPVLTHIYCMSKLIELVSYVWRSNIILKNKALLEKVNGKRS